MYKNMGATFVITAAFMTYDIQKKYCHAVGKVTATQNKLRFTCQDLRAYFTGDTMLTLKRIDARQHVQMHYKTPKNQITITGPSAHFENRQVVFTGGPHVVIASHD
ncbi:MAG: hypothetical protein AAB323_01355 [Pseudomonadota bacterium]